MPIKVVHDLEAQREKEELEEKKRQKLAEIKDLIHNECSNWSADECVMFLESIEELMIDSNKFYREFCETL